MSNPDRAGNPGRSVLILGGTSVIGTAIAQALLVEQQGPVVVAARDIDRARVVAERLRAVGATDAFTVRFDGAEVHETTRAITEATALLGRVDVIILSFGTYADSAELAGDLDATLALVHLNLQGAIAAGEALAELIQSQSCGRILAVSSRPHPWNLENAGVYAASKAGFDTYFASLGFRLRDVGGDVLVIRPPGVNTPLIENNSSYLSAAEVAAEVVMAITNGMTELTILTAEERRLAQRSFPQKVAGRLQRALGRLRRSL